VSCVDSGAHVRSFGSNVICAQECGDEQIEQDCVLVLISNWTSGCVHGHW
jgi:hypothetical protein